MDGHPSLSSSAPPLPAASPQPAHQETLLERLGAAIAVTGSALVIISFFLPLAFFTLPGIYELVYSLANLLDRKPMSHLKLYSFSLLFVPFSSILNFISLAQRFKRWRPWPTLCVSLLGVVAFIISLKLAAELNPPPHHSVGGAVVPLIGAGGWVCIVGIVLAWSGAILLWAGKARRP